MPDTPITEAFEADCRIPFAKLGGFSSLFSRYVEAESDALAFFRYDWRNTTDFDQAAQQVVDRYRDRKVLVEVLSEQNNYWGNTDDFARKNLENLRKDDAVVIVTGQQVGLFGGPLYTVYKAVTAIQLARREAVRMSRPVIPVFWLAGEDHDWEEVRRATVMGAGHPETLAFPRNDSRIPVGRRVLGDEATDVINQLASVLPPKPDFSEVLASLRQAYASGSTARDAFARWMRFLFQATGLILMSADDPRLKKAGSEVFRKELDDPQATFDILEKTGQALKDAGFHQQVVPMPGNLFLIGSEGRFKLDYTEEHQLILRGLERPFTREQLEQMLEDNPQQFSANVILRPILEDALLPTIAYVAGPGETAYYSQLKGVYEHFGVPMPIVFPRVSATIVDRRSYRTLQRYGLNLPDFSGGSEEAVEALYSRIVRELTQFPVAEAMTYATADLNHVADELLPLANEIDPTLNGSTEALRAGLHKVLARFEKKLVRAEKRKHEEIGRQLRYAASRLFPTGHQQERTLATIHLAWNYGPNVVQRLLVNLDLNVTEHQVLYW